MPMDENERLRQERATSQNGDARAQRSDRAIIALKGALCGAALVLIVVGLVWMSQQRFSGPLWNEPWENPNYTSIIYRMGDEEKTFKLYVDPSDLPKSLNTVIAYSGDHDISAAVDPGEELGKPDSLKVIEERVDEAIKKEGGTVLRHEVWYSYDVAYAVSPPTPEDPWNEWYSHNQQIPISTDVYAQ